MRSYFTKRRDYSKQFTDNNTITAVQAMTQYLLSPSDIDGLEITKVRNPYAGSTGPLLVYLEKDVEQKAIEVNANSYCVTIRITRLLDHYLCSNEFHFRNISFYLDSGQISKF